MTAACDDCTWRSDAEHSRPDAIEHANETGHGVWDE